MSYGPWSAARRARNPAAGGSASCAAAGAWSCSTAWMRSPSDDDRLAVADWVERQIAAHPGNHFVVTSRSYGLPGPLAAQADVLVVRPFTAEQVQLFLDRWYLAAERHATGASGRTAQRAVRMRARESAARLTSLLWRASGPA